MIHISVHSIAFLLSFSTVLTTTARAQVLFSETFNDGLAASRWSVVSQQEVRNPPPTLPPDGDVNFAFDYSTLGYVNPNGSADTRGVYIRVNLTDQIGNEGESYSIFPNGMNFAGAFSLELDMLVYNESDTFSTEFGLVGVFLDNAQPVSPYQFGTVGGPLAWEYSGEGGAVNDFATYREGHLTSTGYVPLADYNSYPADTIPGFETGFFGARGPASAATNPRGTWVKVRIDATPSTVTWFLNGTPVNTYDNSIGFYTAGNILIGASDPFNSVSPGSTGVIVDNIVVSVPEPSTFALAAVAIGLVATRRPRASFRV